MKPALLVPLAVLVSVASSYLVCRATLGTPSTQAAETPSVSPAQVEALDKSVRELHASQADLARTLESIKSDLALRSSGEGRVPLADIESAVARALQSRGVTESAEAKVAVAPVTKAKRTAAEAFAEVSVADLSWEDAQKLWRSLREEGLVDDVLALFEKNSKDNPNDATAQIELGKAYLQKLFTVADGPEKGTYAIKADKAFDTALGIDDHNWSARFNKAISLSNWPAFLGKQGEAVKQYQTLLEQQRQVTARPEHAQTYFFLGNLYQSMGKSDQALATWQQGLDLFPGNAQLQGQLQTAQGH